MALFNEPTIQELAIKQVLQDKKDLELSFARFLSDYKRKFNAFWNHPTITPQQMADAWGIEALAMFTKSAATKAYLLTVDPDCLEVEYQTTPQTVTPEIVDGQPTGRMIVG